MVSALSCLVGQCEGTSFPWNGASPGPRHPHEVPWMWPSPSLSTAAPLPCILRDLVSPLAPAEGGLSGARCGWGRCCWFNSGLWVALPSCPFSPGLRASHSPMSFALKWLLLVRPASGYLPSFSIVWKLPLGSLGGVVPPFLCVCSHSHTDLQFL